MGDRYIEHSFPIVQLNPLSVRERSLFKPVYNMDMGTALPYRDNEGTPIDCPSVSRTMRPWSAP